MKKNDLVDAVQSAAGLEMKRDAEAAVEAAQGHVEAEGEEVALVEMAHTVVQPGCTLF